MRPSIKLKLDQLKAKIIVFLSFIHEHKYLRVIAQVILFFLLFFITIVSTNFIEQKLKPTTRKISSCRSVDDAKNNNPHYGYYIADKDVYFFDGKNDFKLPNASHTTFECFSESKTYGSDGHAVYYGNQIIKDADPKSFSAHGYYAKDKKHAYSGGKTLVVNNIKSFEGLENIGSNIEVADFNGTYSMHVAHDDKYLYFDDDRIENSDPQTFNQLYDDGSSPYYDKNNVYVFSENKDSYSIVNDADHKTFKMLAGNKAGNLYKDKNHVYWIKKDNHQSTILNDVDPAKFIMISYSGSYFLHNNQEIYFLESKIDRADPKTFTFILRDDFHNLIFARDKNHYYMNGDVIGNTIDDTIREFSIKYPDYEKKYLLVNNILYPQVTSDLWYIEDPKNLKYLGCDYFSDNSRVYLTKESNMDENNKIFQGPIKNVDPNTFSIIDEQYSQCHIKQGSRVFIWTYSYVGEAFLDELIGANPSTFKVLDKYYSQDDKFVFYQNQTIKDSDPSQFIILTQGYAKDNDTVYFKGTALIDADPDTFQVRAIKMKLDNKKYYLGQDKKNIYVTGKKIDGLNSSTLVLKNYGSILQSGDKTFYLSGSDCDGTEGLTIIPKSDFIEQTKSQYEPTNLSTYTYEGC